MLHTIAILKVEDYDTWKASFASEESKAARKATGEISYQLLRTADDPNKFALLNEWEDEQKMREFIQSEKLRQLQQDSGVIGQPDMYIFREVEKGSI